MDYSSSIIYYIQSHYHLLHFGRIISLHASQPSNIRKIFKQHCYWCCDGIISWRGAKGHRGRVTSSPYGPPQNLEGASSGPLRDSRSKASLPSRRGGLPKPANRLYLCFDFITVRRISSCSRFRFSFYWARQKTTVCLEV